MDLSYRWAVHAAPQPLFANPSSPLICFGTSHFVCVTSGACQRESLTAIVVGFYKHA